MIIKDKEKFSLMMFYYRRKLKRYFKILYSEISLFIIWLVSMYMLLVASVGDLEDKLLVIELYNLIVGLGVIIYATASGLLFIFLVAYLILKFIQEKFK
jgi:hypothetical protein